MTTQKKIMYGLGLLAVILSLVFLGKDGVLQFVGLASGVVENVQSTVSPDGGVATSTLTE